MNLRDYLHIHNISRKDFAKKCGIGIQTLYAVMRGRNARYFDICKIIHATDETVSIFDLLPEDLRSSFERKKAADKPLINHLSLKMPSDEALDRILTKARNHSKFNGKGC